MKVSLVSMKSWAGKVWVAFAFEGEKTPLGITGSDGLGAMATAASEKFEGKPKQVSLLRRKDEKLILAGLGKKKEYSAERVRTAVAKALKRAEEIGAQSVGIVVPDAKEVRGDAAAFAAAAVEGAILGTYRFDRWRTPKPDETKPVTEAALVFANPKNRSAAAQKAVDAAVAKAEAANFVRDLVNEPPSPKPPEKMAEIALGLGVKGRITVKVHHKADLEKLGMNGILRVGAGSHQPPCLVHLTYTPKVKPAKTVAVIGKGITFDSGGLSIKPWQGMEYMKDDMAGAASVLGLFRWLATADVRAVVHGFAAFAENLPGGGAQKPGDVIRHYGGKTAEIVTTDAEGRHLLADCLAYASTLKPDVMIDVATLTGACVVALGEDYSALLGSDQKTIDRLQRLGRQEGEFFWQMPLVDRYKAHLKSKIADVKHVGKTGIAGTITAGLFLAEFVGAGVPWVHIDIAGPSYTKEDWDYIATGATGVPVRTLIEFLRQG